MPEYTVAALAGAAGVVVIELAVLRTGLLRERAYWITLAIAFSFQVLVDGWLTKRSAPIVRYDPDEVTGWRFPWDIPVEDFVFGFAMLTTTLLAWQWSGQRGRPRRGPRFGPPARRTDGAAAQAAERPRR